MLQIINGVWQSTEHTSALLYVSKDGREPFPYGCVQGDTAPLNMLLWDMLCQDSSMITETAEGESESEDVIREEQRQKLMEKVNTQLDSLYAGRILARAEKDAGYAAKRRQKIDALVAALEELDDE